MNIANMSPAERMKAFGLVGLIIVVLFFAVHTLLGTVAPKKQNPPNAGNATGVPGPPPPIGGAAPPAGQPAAVTGVDAFPMDKAFNSSKHTNAEADRSVPDPFVQINDPDSKGSHYAGAPHKAPETKPDIDEAPRGVPFGGAGRSLPPLGGAPFPAGSGGAQGPAPVLSAVPLEPEIKVVGIVHGDTTVATLSVGGTIQIARPGDALAKGYRLMQVTEEGVVVRHGRESQTLRVGAAMNSPAGK